jgi:hypothetical protein
MKRKLINIVIIISFIFIIIIIILGTNYNKNKKWYDYSNQLKEEYQFIKKVKLSNYGPHCRISIFLNKEEFDLHSAEVIFQKFLNRLNQEEFLQCLINYHNKHASGEMAYVDVEFRFKNDNYDIMYQFETDGTNEDRYGLWTLNISQDNENLYKNYIMSDYK